MAAIRLTRSHISTIHASINPFHPPTSRSPLLLLSLLSTPGNTTSLPKPQIKASPSDNINVTVRILERGEERAVVEVGYVDGKVEVIEIGGANGAGTTAKTTATATTSASGTTTTTTGKVYPRRQRKEEESISLLKLVDRVDGWARTLKLKDEGSA